MTQKTCLSEHDLTLCYYRELGDAQREADAHLAACATCRDRFAALAADLDALPELTTVCDPAAGSRMAARIAARRQPPKRALWLTTAGGTLTAAAALVITVINWQPAERPQPPTATTVAGAEFTLSTSDLPEVDFLEELELLEELETLRQIEGV